MAFDLDAWFKRVFSKEALRIDSAPASLPDEVQELGTSTEEKLVELSRDWNGRVREAAVRELARFRTSAALHSIVERLNDWVPQVRRIARDSLEPFLCVEFAGLILCKLDGIIALNFRGRADHSEVLQRVAGVLRSQEARPVLISHLPLCNGRSARYLLDILSAGDDDLGEECLRAFARHPDCLVRLRIVGLCRLRPGRHGAMLAELRHDGHPRVRREALSCMWSHSDQAARAELLEAALLDRAGSVREIAIWYARKSGFDLEGFAVKVMTNAKPEVHAKLALLGLLTALKMSAGLGFAHAELRSESAALRAAALSFLVSVQRELADEHVAAALADSSNKVARLARVMILRGQVALTHAQYMSATKVLLLSAHTGRALSVCALMAMWARLEALLMCLVESREEEDRTMIKNELLRWEYLQGRSSIRIDAAERDRLKVLLGDRGIREMVRAERRLVFALQTNGLWSDE